MVTKEKALNLPTDYPIVNLSDKLLNGLEEIAIMRSKRESGLPISRVEDTVHSHFVGLCGEAAVAAYYDIPMNLTYDHPIDPGYDFLIKYIPKNTRYKIDVKTSTRVNGDLLVPTTSGNADIYLSCIKHNSNVILRGTATHSVVTNADTISIENEEVYAVPKNNLYDIPEQSNIENVDLDMEELSAVDIDDKDLAVVKDKE